MQTYFRQLADALVALCKADEVLLVNFHGERSDFVRLNNAKIRQPGTVLQQYVTVELIRGQRHLSETFTACGNAEADLARGGASIETLRSRLDETPDDPYLLYATEVRNTEAVGDDNLPATTDAISAVLDAADGRDLVGIYAAGEICRGFANSLGQRNWFSTHSFHLDWSLYAHGDKAVKTSYAGRAWADREFQAKSNAAVEQLAILGREPKTVDPGEYRVYLAPAAFAEFVGMLGMDGFSLKAHRTKQTALLKMIEAGATLHPSVTLTENTADGLGPNFTTAGYVKPDVVPLITEGRFAQCLVSPRSSKEFGEPVNAGREWPASLDMAAGSLDAADAVSELGEGIYANQLWYLNYSDHAGCRLTGMTRFATFWVEGGQIVAPLNVMRFDETAYRALGENLVALTKQRDFLPDAGTYDQRSTDSIRLGGALIDKFRFTL